MLSRSGSYLQSDHQRKNTIIASAAGSAMCVAIAARAVAVTHDEERALARRWTGTAMQRYWPRQLVLDLPLSVHCEQAGCAAIYSWSWLKNSSLLGPSRLYPSSLYLQGLKDLTELSTQCPLARGSPTLCVGASGGTECDRSSAYVVSGSHARPQVAATYGCVVAFDILMRVELHKDLRKPYAHLNCIWGVSHRRSDGRRGELALRTGCGAAAHAGRAGGRAGERGGRRSGCLSTAGSPDRFLCTGLARHAACIS
jgi:hypothetical protein